MKVKGTIKVVNERRNGVSETTGAQWCVQDVVLELENTESPQYPERLVATMSGFAISEFDRQRIGVGSVVNAELHFNTIRTRSGFVTTRISLTNVRL